MQRERTVKVGGDLGSAESLALEAGDKQRAAYLHLALAGEGAGATERKMIAESLASFRALQDRIGIHHALRRRAWGENDWGSVRKALERAAAELDGTDEPLSSVAHLNAAEASLHLGDLRSARRSLELAREAKGYPSLSLSLYLPSLPPLVNGRELELGLLTEEDRIDEAEVLARSGVRESEDAFGHLCWLQCARGQWTLGAQCFEQLLGQRPRTDRWGEELAQCYWDAGDLEHSEKAATDSSNRTIIDATVIANVLGGREAKESLEKTVLSLVRDREVLEQLRTELVLGTAEMRASRTKAQAPFGSLPRLRSEWAAARRRVEGVLAEARRRDLPLLVRQARTTLARELPPSDPTRPNQR